MFNILKSYVLSYNLGFVAVQLMLIDELFTCKQPCIRIKFLSQSQNTYLSLRKTLVPASLVKWTWVF